MGTSDFPRVTLKPKRARPLFGRHPWVFESAVGRIDGDPQPGAVVRVDSSDREFIGYGLWNPHSKIQVRLYSWDKSRLIDGELIDERIGRAIDFREKTLGLNANDAGVRWVFSESDGLSGLTVDRFSDVAVCRFTSLGLLAFQEDIAASLLSRRPLRGIVRQIEPAAAQREQISQPGETIHGRIPSEGVRFLENGIELWADPLHGQKTGAYLDQRDNRFAIRRYSNGRSVLDVFCHGAGFGISALKAGADSLVAVDSSGPAIALAQRNVDSNRVAAEFIHQDAMVAMERLKQERRRFGLVICDPPKFSPTADSVSNARKAYERVNRLAFELLEREGILVSCSCSGSVSHSAFVEMLVEVAQQCRRDFRILERRGQATDHAVSAFCLENDYLKCVIGCVG